MFALPAFLCIFEAGIVDTEAKPVDELLKDDSCDVSLNESVLSSLVKKTISENFFEQAQLTFLIPMNITNSKGQCCWKGTRSAVEGCTYKIFDVFEVYRSSTFILIRCDKLYNLLNPWEGCIYFSEETWYIPMSLEHKQNKLLLSLKSTFQDDGSHYMRIRQLQFGSSWNNWHKLVQDLALPLTLAAACVAVYIVYFIYSEDVKGMRICIQDQKLLTLSLFLTIHAVIIAYIGRVWGAYIDLASSSHQCRADFIFLLIQLLVISLIIAAGVFLVVKYAYFQKQYWIPIKLIIILNIVEYSVYHGIFILFGLLTWPLLTTFIILKCASCIFMICGAFHTIFLLFSILHKVCCKHRSGMTLRVWVELLITVVASVFLAGVWLCFRVIRDALFLSPSDDLFNLLSFSNGIILTAIGTLFAGLVKWCRYPKRLKMATDIVQPLPKERDLSGNYASKKNYCTFEEP